MLERNKVEFGVGLLDQIEEGDLSLSHEGETRDHHQIG